MKILQRLIVLIAILSINQACYATFFNIEKLRIGPNPLVQGKDPIIINYVATLAHSAEYYVYTVTGELILKKKFEYNIPNITHAGECQFVLLNSLAMGRVPKQLYVVIIVFKQENNTVKKKKYVIVK
ncbi:hypothetical protein DID73_01195 [Candidatus Marinamargulisbacteria bacterium SCGC AG-343-K17]|nr:hypothetical protein DID73_01195 [Candidatus Marinamargulisbacteria bacterium SCGC AG-343-K17]